MSEDLTWSRGRSAHPRLRIDVGGPPAGVDVVETLAAAFAEHRHRVVDRTGTGFKARHLDWFALAAADIRYSRLRVDVAPAASGTTVTLVVEEGHHHRPGRRHAGRALEAAVRHWRSEGRTVDVGPWEYPTGLGADDWTP